MTASLREAAQLTLVATADVTEFAQLRDSVGAGARKPGYVNAVIRACAQALRDHPAINARLDGERSSRGLGEHRGGSGSGSGTVQWLGTTDSLCR